MKHILTTALFALAATVLASDFQLARAQQQPPTIDFPKPSPNSTIKDHVGLASVEVAYSRPSMKGRKIFGGRCVRTRPAQ